MAIRNDNLIYNLNGFVTTAFINLTVGLPFAMFKSLLGVSLYREYPKTIISILGVIILVWGSIDFVMNVTSLMFSQIKKRFIAPCILALIGKAFGTRTLFLAINTLCSFSCICIMLWTGLIGKLSSVESIIWNIATTINLISMATIIIWNEFYVLKNIYSRINRDS